MRRVGAFLIPAAVAVGVGLMLVGVVLNQRARGPSHGPAATLRTDSLAWAFAHDEKGRLDYLDGPGNRRVAFAYGDLPGQGGTQVTKRTSDGTTTTFDFDRSGRRLQMRDAAGVTTYGYDDSGRLIWADRTGSARVSYAYDRTDRITALRVGDRFESGYRYDFLGRVEQIDTPFGAISYLYSAGERAVIRTLPNGVQTVWKRRPEGALDSITHTRSDGRIIARYKYSYRPDGRIAMVAELSSRGERTLTFEYDDMQRLSGAQDSRGPTIRYEYDSAGNRTRRVEAGKVTQHAAHDWAGRIVRLNDKQCRHDEAANFAGCGSGDLDSAFEFDHENQLRKVAAGERQVTYEYDGDGLLIGRGADGGYTTFAPDPLSPVFRPLAELRAGKAPRYFVWDGEMAVASVQGEAIHYFLADHLGSVRTVLDQSAETIAEFDYGPFGEDSPPTQAGGSDSGDRLRPAPGARPMRVPTAAMSGSSAPFSGLLRAAHAAKMAPPSGAHHDAWGTFAQHEFSLGYAGLFRDGPAGLYITRERAYSPSLGRFVQQEPVLGVLSYVQSRSIGAGSGCTYCGNDPQNCRDGGGCSAKLVNPLTVDWLAEVRRWNQQLQAEAKAQQLTQLGKEFDQEVPKMLRASLESLARDLEELQRHVSGEPRAGDFDSEYRKVREKWISNIDRALDRYAQELGKRHSPPELIEQMKLAARDSIRAAIADLAMARLQPERVTGDLNVYRLLRSPQETYSHQELMADLVTLHDRFSDTSYKLAQVYRNQLDASRTALLRSSVSSEALRASTGVFNTFFDGVQTGVKVLETIGTAMQAMNPPENLQDMRPWSWEGHSTRSFADGTVYTRHSEFRPFDDPNLPRLHGTITLIDSQKVQSNLGTFERREISSTRTANFMERLMALAFPLGAYGDETTSTVRVTRSDTRHREITEGGVRRLVEEPRPSRGIAEDGARRGGEGPRPVKDQEARITPATDRRLLITDRGIMQYDRADFRFFYDDHVVLKLPSDDRKDPSFGKSARDVEDECYTAIRDYFERHPRVRNLEVRILQDVSAVGYATGALPWSDAQRRAKEYTEAALAGVQRAKSELGIAAVGAVAGSNAGWTITSGLVSLARRGLAPVDRVYFDDPQVKRRDVEDLIGAIGADRVALLVTRGGFHGSLETFGPDFLRGPLRGRGELASNPRIAEELVKAHPGVQLWYFNPAGLIDFPLGLGGYEGRHTYPFGHPTDPIPARRFDSASSAYGPYGEVRVLDLVNRGLDSVAATRSEPTRNTTRTAIAVDKQKDAGPPDTERREAKARPRTPDAPFPSQRQQPPPPSSGDPSDDGGGGGGGAAGMLPCQRRLLKMPSLPAPPSVGMNPLQNVLHRPPNTPSRVGGVYLGGAGRALAGLGQLAGVALDPLSGRLVLVSREEGEIALPPLRLEDIVTVFRSVYQHGQAPSVSIDPDPNDPKGPRLLVSHGHGTENTYVGWVLFEADRLMKSYSLGRDNVSRETLTSRAPGFRTLLSLKLAEEAADASGISWERFWIVPAGVERRQSERRFLTLVDVPLRVETERMEFREGKLVTASDPRPSLGAKAFSQWFSARYRDIAREAFSAPPIEAGLGSSVAVYEELQRIALVAAIAEALRDQGVPLPDWMRDYPVQSVPITPTTPSIVVEGTASGARGESPTAATRVLRIFGGVNLSPEDRVVRTFTSREADHLAAPLARALSELPSVSTTTVNSSGGARRIATLPGPHTQDVGAALLQETDVSVAIAGGGELRFTRKFNSFFQPRDVFGRAWTLDLPRLEQQLRPIRRAGNRAEFSLTYHLTTPLGTASVRFGPTGRAISDYGAPLASESPSDMVLLARAHHQRLGSDRDVVVFKDGRRWYFDERGDLNATEEAGVQTIDWRDAPRRIVRIEAWIGSTAGAHLDLEYDEKGRVASVRGSDGSTARYVYDSEGLLVRVDSAARPEYEYQNDLVTRINKAGRPPVAIQYTAQGQVAAVRAAGEPGLQYETTSTVRGITVTARREGDPEPLDVAEYDRAMRPVRRRLADGTLLEWSSDAAGSRTASVQLADGRKFAVAVASDGSGIVRSDNADGLSLALDNLGRAVELRSGGKTVMRWQWRDDGRPTSVVFETAATHVQYRPDGHLGALLFTQPGDGPRLDRWMKVDLDESGRARELSDYSGGRTTIEYGSDGKLKRLAANDSNVELVSDALGRLRNVRSNWGYSQESTYTGDASTPDSIRILNGGRSASMEFDAGRVRKLSKFDGSEMEFWYYGEGPNAGGVKAVRLPNGALASYDYDEKGRITAETLTGAYRLDYRYDEHGRVVGIARAPANRK